jgi:hypothetical protein
VGGLFMKWPLGPAESRWQQPSAALLAGVGEAHHLHDPLNGFFTAARGHPIR